MTRLRGRSLRGRRLFSATPHGPWMTTTLIAALGIDGIRRSTVVDWAVNGDVFQALLPVLKSGDIVVTDWRYLVLTLTSRVCNEGASVLNTSTVGDVSGIQFRIPCPELLCSPHLQSKESTNVEPGEARPDMFDATILTHDLRSLRGSVRLGY